MWKEKNTPKEISKFGWEAVLKREAQGWVWIAKKIKNGAVLSNGPFDTIGLAKMDFYEAVRE